MTITYFDMSPVPHGAVYSVDESLILTAGYSTAFQFGIAGLIGANIGVGGYLQLWTPLNRGSSDFAPYNNHLRIVNLSSSSLEIRKPDGTTFGTLSARSSFSDSHWVELFSAGFNWTAWVWNSGAWTPA